MPDSGVFYFDFVPDDAAAATLPPCSRETLGMIAREREFFRRQALAKWYTPEQFANAYPLIEAAWLLELTCETARALASGRVPFILSLN